MAKFHIDPAGNPGLCRATKRCPFGGLQKDHYASEPIARKAYELENTPRTLAFGPNTKKLMSEIGPRQLPNRAWVTLSRAFEDDRFSEHDLAIAVTAVSEEWEKLSEITSKPLYRWGNEERDAASGLGAIAQLSAEMSLKAELWEKERHAQLRREFGDTSN